MQAFSYGIAFGRIDLKFRRIADGSWQIDRPATTIHPPIEVCQVALPTTPVPAQPEAPAASMSEVAAAKPESGGAAPTRRPPSGRCDARLLEGSDLRPCRIRGRPVVANTVINALAPFVERAVARANMPVGVTLAQRVRRNFRNESALGQLLADLMRTGAARVVGRPIDLAVQTAAACATICRRAH